MTTVTVPFFVSPWQSRHALAAARIDAVLANGGYILGAEVNAFEAEFSAWLDGRAVVGVNSGTDALVLALRVLDLGPGDEVILPAYTFFACFEAVVRVGATPVLVDTAEEDYLPAPAQIEAAITARTRAVLVVPLFGDTTGLRPLLALCRARDLLLIEDVAQACGGMVPGVAAAPVRAGMLGDASAFSFFPTKNLGAAGDAGAVSFRDPALAARCRALRNHAYADGEHGGIGLNSRLDELQAALLRIGLGGLAEQQSRRREIAACYLAAWGDLAALRLPASTPGHAWNYFVVCHPRRDELRHLLAEAGVDTRIYYPQPIHWQPAYRAHYPALSLPHCEKLAAESLALPMYPNLSDAQVAAVVAAMRQACARLERIS